MNTAVRLLSFAMMLLLSGCASPIANRTPVNETFPTVMGENLNRQTVTLPADLEGKNRLLLIGYVQDAQFDIDRWLIGLDMTSTNVTAYEIPTINGLAPRMFETVINDGMRAGIPKMLWGGVITVYDDAAKIVAITGNENENNARVLLLDENNTIVFYHDKGFSVEALNALKALTGVKGEARY